MYVTLPEADRALPPTIISANNTTWHWSVGRTDGHVLIGVDSDPNRLREVFEEVWEAGRVLCDYCMNWRSDMTLWVARGPKVPVGTVWARDRHYE